MSVAKSPIERAEERLKTLEDSGTEADAQQDGKGEQAQPSQEQAPNEEPSKPTEDGKPPEDGQKQAKSKKKDEPSTDPNDEDWEQKFKSLNGMLPRLRRENEALKEEIAEIRRSMESFKPETSSGDNALPQTADLDSATLQEHMKALHEEFGEEFIVYLKTLIRSEATGMINSRVSPVEERVEQNQKSQEDTQRSNFKTGLTQQVPDWESIYYSDDFDNWLNANTEPLSGRTYAVLFKAANDDWNMAGMVKFFEAFKQATGRAPSQQARQPQGDPRENLVAPDSSGNATSNNVPPKGQNQKIWKEEEVRQFYKDVQLGQYLGREDEQAAIDQEIFLANLEDRIRR